jgi:hypothetical protein
LLKAEQEVGGSDLSKNTLIIKEEAPKGILTWLRKSEKELLNIEIAGHLAKAASHSKLIAGAVAGGFIGMGVVLLNLWQKHTAEKERRLIVQQVVASRPSSSQAKANVELVDKLPLPLETTNVKYQKQKHVTVSAQPETVQAFWEKSREKQGNGF